MTDSIRLRDPGSAITHFIGLLFALAGTLPLIMRGFAYAGRMGAGAMSVFSGSMILLYAASTLYHSIQTDEKKLKIFKRLDHTMIFVLIAGTYTPICLLVLSSSSGRMMLILIWSVAAAGVLFKLFWVTCPKWVSSVIYTVMGWACLLVLGELFRRLPRAGFYWLLSGGILYTVGAVIYALKPEGFNLRHRVFGSHEIFHLFVMGGSLCHYICMYGYVLS